MTITRTAATPGPVDATISAETVDINVLVEDIPYAVAEADGVDDITLTGSGKTLTVRIKQTETVVAGRGMNIVSGRNTVVNGIVVNHGGGVVVVGDYNGTISVNSGQISVGKASKVTLRLPVGSTLEASTRSGNITTTGHMSRVHARSTSGDVEIDSANNVTAATVSGDIEVGSLNGRGNVNSTSGDVRIHASGDSIVYAQTISGDVRVTKTRGVTVDVDARSVSGRTRVS